MNNVRTVICPTYPVMCKSDRMVWIDEPTHLSQNNEEELIYTDLDSLKNSEEKGNKMFKNKLEFNQA